MDTTMCGADCMGYKSPAQRARCLTEAWFAGNMYCPACPSTDLQQAQRNARVLDFTCPLCGAHFELKAQAGPFGRKVCDAAYSSMVERISSGSAPHFAFLHYDREALRAVDLFLVPAHFLTEQAIERRKPLAPGARRAGWVGCNILLDEVPPDGRVAVLTHGDAASPAWVRAQWSRFGWLADQDVATRGWTAAVLRCLRSAGRRRFALSDAYEWEAELAERYPANRNVRPKIRQQLQILRDRGILRFLGGGQYEVLD